MAVQTTSPTSGITSRQAKYTHPTYLTLQPVWQKLRDVREGTGGFLDGTYLVAHPREWADHTNDNPRVPTKKLRARRTLASYENFAKTIVLSLKDALTREQPVRRVGEQPDVPQTPPPEPPKDGPLPFAKAAPPKPARPAKKPKGEETALERWWENVDGAQTHIDDFMQTIWDLAATFGHVYVYMDRAPTPASVETAADEPMPFLRVYTPLDVWDWLTDDIGELSAIKFAELAPRENLETSHRLDVQVRVVDRERWTLYDSKGARIDGGAHSMGRLPVIPVFAQRRPMEAHVGDSVLGDPKLYIDLYNLKSEVRELLRNQTFSILNIPLGTGPDAMTVEQAVAMIGSTKGTENALFSGLAASFIQADTGNIAAYHEEMQRTLRTIYRIASLTWEADSKDAEAEGSLKLKREDMNQRLAGYADELERADYLLAELFYRATEGADVAVQKLEDDEVQIKYPDTFDMTPFEQVLEQAQAAMDLGMPALFLKELRKRLARKFDGMADLPPNVMDAIDQAIDSAPDDLTPAEQTKQRTEMMVSAMKTTGQPKLPKVEAA